jgi:hypothetical protein
MVWPRVKNRVYKDKRILIRKGYAVGNRQFYKPIHGYNLFYPVRIGDQDVTGKLPEALTVIFSAKDAG